MKWEGPHDTITPTMRRLISASLLLACTALYYLTRSPALDEWDSVQFALGVGDFNLWKHQPHPPGYPLYVAFGWLGERLLGLNVQDALALGSALGGGLFVAGWFVLISRRFPRPVAAISTASVAGLVDTWMTSTKVLTDPLGTGLLTLALVLLDRLPTTGESRRMIRWRVGTGSLAAAAAVGVRPQNFGVLLLIVVLAIIGTIRRGQISRRAGWLWGGGLFVAGCLAWVIPVLAMQAHTPESAGSWGAYGGQLVAQWRWRLDQPKAFLGAAGQGQGMLLYRVDHHLLGWFTRGFGFSLKSPWGWLGLAIVVAGWIMYLPARRREKAALAGSGFWKTHLPWAVTYVLMIFCCLPGDQRYYLPIFPLFILAAVAGWWFFLRGPWRWSALAVPVAALAATLPLVGPNHTDEAPPVRLLRWLQARYPAGEQPGVWLILRDSRRHAQWYAPGFHLVAADKLDPVNPFVDVEQARAVYTDDPLVLARWPFSAAAWHRVAHFQRSPLIYRKHNEVDLYQLEPGQPPE